MPSARKLVLLYHRVGTPMADPWALFVSPQHFEEHLGVLERVARVVPLSDLIDAPQAMDGRVRVAITFDDGYADNLLDAAPRLASHGMPATFFIPTAALECQREFWWDDLERVFLEPGELPGWIDLEGVSKVLGVARQYSEADAVRHADWRAWLDPPPTPRHELFLLFWHLCHRRPAPAQRALIDALLDWGNVGVAGRDSHRTLRRCELRTLASSPLVAIGAHTVNHVRLSDLSPEDQRSEIEGSKTTLERELGRPVVDFAYPFGGVRDFNEATATIVASCQFRLACANINGLVDTNSDRLRLPRLFVRDCEGDTLLRDLLGTG